MLRLCIAFLLCTACGSKKGMANASSQMESEPKIIFLNYRITKNNDGSKEVQFINKVITEGKLKNIISSKNGILDDLLCIQQDKKSNALKSIVVKNPLRKTIEFIDDSKNFQTKIIDLDSTEFSLRLKLEKETRYIIITNFADGAPLIKTKIY